MDLQTALERLKNRLSAYEHILKEFKNDPVDKRVTVGKISELKHVIDLLEGKYDGVDKK